MIYTIHGKGIMHQQLDGDEQPELLVPHGRNIFPQQWLSDGQTLLYTKVEAGKATSIDAYTLTLGDRPARIPNSMDMASLAVSWDERWIAYCTWPAGVYVADFPALRATTLVSKTGCAPKWGHNDEKLFYLNVGKLLSVDIAFDDGIVLGEQTVVADLGIRGDELYDVHRSGFVAYAHHRYTDPKPPVIISGWQNLLKTSSRSQ